MSNKIKVLVIDDSALVRRILRNWINGQVDTEVISTAADPYIAVEKIRVEKPDVITLDIEMPRMDGLTFLRQLMAQHPIPVIIVSSLSAKNSEVAFRAFDLGAVGIFQKEDIRLVSKDNDRMEVLLDMIRVAGRSTIKRQNNIEALRPAHRPELTKIKTSDKVIVMGASTGGTNAIREIVCALPVTCPGMVIVQHMPKDFTKQFAMRLDELSPLSVKEVEDGDRVTMGRVLIAPGDKHIQLVRQGVTVLVRTWNGPLVNRHKPSVDVLFESAAQQLCKNAIGVLLTGMGKDGAAGLLSMKKSGAYTIAQDEATSIVYGMPREAVKLNAVDKVLPLFDIPEELLKIC